MGAYQCLWYQHIIKGKKKIGKQFGLRKLEYTHSVMELRKRIYV